ncbi:high mobility group B protein 14 [Macadamia integrifolia]|uniref:high mobility group B protein 14 n=1 Tax=Macadamia integrifolia TaxID=60698 RepID=UPI001C52AF9B|nr:high mobility group B protein 14 [Macadamia integrifolia]
MVKKTTESEEGASAETIEKASEKTVVLKPKASAKTKRAAKPKAKTKKKTKKEDANKPRKPPTAFFYFLEDFRKEFQEKNPDVKSMRDIGKACGEKWKTMTYEEKVQYYDIATEKRAEFEEAMQEYIKRKERGEDQESESEDSDY